MHLYLLKKHQCVSNEQVITDAQDFIVILKSVIKEINHLAKYTVRGTALCSNSIYT